MKFLVVGDGVLGNLFIKFLKSKGIDFLSTTRRQLRVSPETIYLDLLDLSEFSVPLGVTHAIILAGINGYAQCMTDPNSEVVNIYQVSSLVSLLMRNGIKTFYISSSAVFSADNLAASEDVTPDFDSEYGYQKANCEKLIVGYADRDGFLDNLVVIRPTKVLTMGSPPFLSWKQCLLQNFPISCLENAFFAPISSNYFCDFILTAACNRSSGIYHLSGKESISYFEFGKQLCAKIGANSDLVVPIKIENLAPPPFYVHKSGFLSQSRTVRDFGIFPQPLDRVLDDLFK